MPPTIDTPRPPWQRQLPNLLTSLRVALAAAFVVALSLYQHAAPTWRGHLALPILGLALFVVAALTDAADGYLARRWRVVSVFGRVMDPFADKVLVLGALILLAGPSFTLDGRQVSGVAPWMVVVILARDLLVTSLRALVESQGHSFAAIPAGKIKMIVQSIGLPLILLLVCVDAASDPDADHWTRTANTVIAWAVTLVTAWSGAPYVSKGVRQLSAEAAP